MLVRKFCACGVKLERDVTGEDTARRVVSIFRMEHSGSGHGPINSVQYAKVIRKIIQRKVQAKQNPQPQFNQRNLPVFRVIQGGRHGRR